MSAPDEYKEKADEIVETWIRRYRRGSLRFFILHLLLHKHKNSCSENSSKPCKCAFHGYMLKKAIRKVTNEKWEPTTASIYPIIKELDKEGVIARIPESEAGQEKSSRPMKQYQLTPFGILVAERLENARRDFAKAFIMKGKGKHHPPPPLFKGLTKEELSEALNEADLEALEGFQKHLEHRIRHDQRILKEVEKEIKVKKG